MGTQTLAGIQTSQARTMATTGSIPVVVTQNNRQTEESEHEIKVTHFYIQCLQNRC